MDTAKQLLDDEMISAGDYENIKAYDAARLFSVHWELRTILYLGILLLTTGLGILIYLNIDTIGHQAVLAIIGLLCAGCFYYVFRNRQPYRHDAVKQASPFFDYVALLACLLLGIFIGYIQFQYALFGHRYGLATLIPAAVFLYCAYLFDHKGLLSLAIVGIAGTIGLSIAPMQLVNGYDLSATHIVFTALVFGAALIGWSKISETKQIKKHFSFTYHNFGINILFASCLTLLFNQPMKVLSIVLLIGLCLYFVRYAIAQQSFWFLLLAVVYSYIGLTYAVFSLLLDDASEAVIIISMFYLMASCIGVILFFINYKKYWALKMIAYNKTGLRNNAVVKKARQWYTAHLLSDEQYAGVVAKYPSNFYNPNLFIKIGLFLFTCIAVNAALGFYALLFMNAFEGEGFVTFTAFFFACGTFVLLEFLIRNTRVHHSGNDEALLYVALIATATGLYSLFGYELGTHQANLLFCLLMSPVLLAAVIRYADRLVAFVLCMFCYAILFLVVLKTGAIAKLLMPFALMILSVIIYVYARKVKTKSRLFFWKECISVFEGVALLVFYSSGNYFAIRESGTEFFGMALKPGQDIPLAFFFYIFTAIVPLLYVFFGLKRKDKLLLWTGLVLIGAAVLTFKYYFSLGHPEITLTVAGIIMILVAYAAIKYLKTPKYGITFDEETDEENFLKTNAEALVLAQTFAHPAASEVKDSGSEFGGGESGGGGAGGSF